MGSGWHGADLCHDYIDTLLDVNKAQALKFYTELVKEYGFVLVRSKRHFVFRDAKGRTFVASKTTANPRSIKNHISDLKRLLKDHDSNHAS